MTADRIAYAPDGRPLGRRTMEGPLAPVPAAFAYVWDSPDEARAVAAAYAAGMAAGRAAAE